MERYTEALWSVAERCGVLQSRYKTLRKRYGALLKRHGTLQNRYAALRSRHRTLRKLSILPITNLILNFAHRSVCVQ